MSGFLLKHCGQPSFKAAAGRGITVFQTTKNENNKNAKD